MSDVTCDMTVLLLIIPDAAPPSSPVPSLAV